MYKDYTKFVCAEVLEASWREHLCKTDFLNKLKHNPEMKTYIRPLPEFKRWDN